MASIVELLQGSNAEMIFQLLLASLLGGLLGIEREFLHRSAGLRTHILVSLGAAVFALISSEAYAMFSGISSFDPSRVASQIVVGIGFIGAGAIIHRGDHVHGTTTAAGLWIAAAIGLAVGTRLYVLAVAATLIAVLVLLFVHKIEYRLNTKTKNQP